MAQDVGAPADSTANEPTGLNPGEKLVVLTGGVMASLALIAIWARWRLSRRSWRTPRRSADPVPVHA
jgi:hypothetical protein